MAKQRKADFRQANSFQKVSAPVATLMAAGKYRDAATLAALTLESTPNNPELLHFLGVAKERMGDHAGALEALHAARQFIPNDPNLHNHLGIVLESLDLFKEAAAAYEEAIRLSPNLADAHGNLASLLVKQEQPREALDHVRIALRTQKDNPHFLVTLGDALEQVGESRAAIEAHQRALRHRTPPRRAYTSLARLLIHAKKPDQAIEILERGRKDLGDEPLILNDLGLTLGSQGKFAEAQPLFETAYQRLKEPTTLYNVITNLSKLERWQEAFALEHEVMQYKQPNIALPPLFSIAVSCNNWDVQERLLSPFLEWCSAEETKLEIAVQYSIYLLSHPTIQPSVISDILKKSAERFGRLLSFKQPHFDYKPAFENNRKLRIGYLSGDFKFHVVNHHVSGQFSHYDKQYFEVYCYSNLDEDDEDDITSQYREATDKFVNVSKLPPQDLAKIIHDDGIHILIDLSGHTAKSNLVVMAFRPAPVQISYLGFPFTTGLKQVDYYLCDKYLNCPGNKELFVEKLLEIPESYVTGGALAINPSRFDAAVQRNKYVTYGTLNNPYKLNRRVIAAWSRILAATAGAKLVLNHPRYSADEIRNNIVREFKNAGADISRISFITERRPPGQHLSFYEDIDIALDTFPLTGGTTTYESLWMGVPVVTCVGDVNYQRLSYSILKNCGADVDDLIGFSEEEFIAKAIALGNNPQRIVALHDAIGRNIRHSILCDPARQVRGFEDALIDAWNQKFPGQMKFVPGGFAYTRLNTPAAPLVATTPDAGNLHHYVVQEQGRWFAPEYTVLKKLAEHLAGLAVEIGAEPGFFSLELAQAGMNALCLSTSTVAARQIRAAAERGNVSERVEVRLESPRSSLLDHAKLDGVALLRIGVEANDGAAGPIDKNPGFWERNTPVVLVSIHTGDTPDLSTAEALAAMSYSLYRFLPGLECFVPYAIGQPLDAYVLYLLACPPRLEAALVAGGIVVLTVTPIPGEEIAMLPTPGQAVADTCQQIDEWVMRCDALARDPNRSIQERLGYHEAALHTQLAVTREAPSTTRLISLARLLAEAGERAQAVSLLSQALSEFEGGSARLTRPFLAPSVTWDAIPAGDHLAEWLLASLLETRCRLAAHSTQFLSNAELSHLDIIPTLGFSTDFLARVQRIQREDR